MTERIEIDAAVLEQEITTLAGIRTQQVINRSPSFTSVGPTAQVAGQMAGLFEELNKCLNTLIDHTRDFLTNARDGFIDLDEAAAATARRLAEEVEP